MRLVYTSLFYALLPLIAARSAWRSKQRGYPARMRERLANYETPTQSGVLWFHAVSVGEVEAAMPVIRSLLKRRPSASILITCTTPTGSSRIREVLGDSVSHVFLPYDLPDAVNRFLDHFEPVAGIILETEIWPNLYRACQKRQLPLAIINARLSDASARGYRKLAKLTRECMHAVSAIAAQTPEDAQRFIDIGAAPEKLTVTGNIKFDIQYDDRMRQHSQRLRTELFPDRPVFIAGSTHPGEEEQVLDALAEIHKQLPNTLLLLAPRHPERSEQVYKLSKQRGLEVVRRSEQRPCGVQDSVFLIDTLGELRTFFGAADVAFVGGSLVPTGGHNVLEPAIVGLPVLFGPHMHNFKAIANKIGKCGGGIQVENARILAEQTLILLTQSAHAREVGEKGRAFVEANRGAVERVVDLIDSLIQPHSYSSNHTKSS